MTPASAVAAVGVYNSLNNEAEETSHDTQENTTMQQAIYNSISDSDRTASAATTMTAFQAAGLLRWVSRKWDLVGVLALMGSSAAYGVFALAHQGL